MGTTLHVALLFVTFQGLVSDMKKFGAQTLVYCCLITHLRKVRKREFKWNKKTGDLTGLFLISVRNVVLL